MICMDIDEGANMDIAVELDIDINVNTFTNVGVNQTGLNVLSSSVHPCGSFHPCGSESQRCHPSARNNKTPPTP